MRKRLPKPSKLQFVVTSLHTAGPEWRRSHPRNCPVRLTDGDGRGGLGPCWHTLEDGVCPTHGVVYRIPEDKFHMTPDLALRVTRGTQDQRAFKMYTDEGGQFYFDKDHMQAVYGERKRRGWPVAGFNVDISEGHSMMGKRLLLKDGTEVTVKSVHRQWYFGYYVVLTADTDSGSGMVLYWENIDVFYPWLRKRIEKSRSLVEVLSK